MTNKNEIMVNQETGEIIENMNNNVVRETEDYIILKTDDGKFTKKMKYHDFASSKPETEEEKIELFRVFNDEENSDLVTPMKSVMNKQFKVVDYYIQAYESFDEETGGVDYGAVTTLKAENGQYITTSSKSVYYTIRNIHDVFDLPFIVKVVGTKREKGTQINLSLVGK